MHLREQVINIADSLERGDLDPDARYINAGARLALDLIADSVAQSSPRFQAMLVKRAVALLDTTGQFDRRLTMAAEAHAETFFEELSARLNSDDRIAVSNAFHILCLLGSTNAEAFRLIETVFASDHKKLMVILAESAPVLPKILFPKVIDAQRRAGESMYLRYFVRFFNHDPEDVERSHLKTILLYDALKIPGFNIVPNDLTVQAAKGFATGYMTLDGAKKAYASAGSLDSDGWPTAKAIAHFAAEPSKLTLASAIRAVAVSRTSTSIARLRVPWPLQSLIYELNEGKDAETLAVSAEDGDFGDLDEWKAAEARIEKVPSSKADFESWTNGTYIDSRIAWQGIPAFTAGFRTGNSDGLSLSDIMDIADRTTNPVKVSRLLWLATWLLTDSPRNRKAMTRYVDKYFSVLIPGSIPTAERRTIFSASRTVWQDPRVAKLADQLGRTGTRALKGPVQPIVEAFNRDTELRGLLSVLAFNGVHDFEFYRSLAPEAFEVRSTDEEVVAAAVQILRLRVDSNRIDDLQLSAACVVAGGLSALNAAARILKDELVFEFDRRQEYASELARQAKMAGLPITGFLHQVISSQVAARKTDLGAPENRKRLGLPPHPPSEFADLVATTPF